MSLVSASIGLRVVSRSWMGGLLAGVVWAFTVLHLPHLSIPAGDRVEPCGERDRLLARFDACAVAVVVEVREATLVATARTLCLE